MNRKLLFFDIDGTLLAGGIPGYIPDSAIEALKQAQANGHYIFINSGRTYWFMPEAIKEFPFDGYVCGCGTEVIFHGETLYHYDLDDSLKRSLDDILTEGFTKIIVGEKDIDFFDTLVADWEKAGGEKATEEINTTYGNK